jgi:hypothetical protein
MSDDSEPIWPVPLGDVDAVRRALRLSIDEKKVEFDDVVRLRYWQAHPAPAAKPWRELGYECFDDALSAFKGANGSDTRVVIYGRSGLGAYKTDSQFRYLVLASGLRFDWSDGQGLVIQVDGLAERAKTWWEPIIETGKGRRKATAVAERRRFLDRDIGLLSSILTAIDQENPKERSRDGARSDLYKAKISSLTKRVDEEAQELTDALQRSAQACYGRGMLFGALAIVAVSAVLGVAFSLGDVSAVYGVAFPAGAVGAIVSVLQRMTSTRPSIRLELDVGAGHQMLTTYGGLRPVVGAILGYAVFVFLKGGLLPALAVTTTSPLATFAGLGFLGGFNERWAQDMFAASARRLQRRTE